MVEAESGDPAQQVVGERADDDPRRVREELPGRRVVPPGAFFEIADRELDDRVVAVIGVQGDGGAVSSGERPHARADAAWTPRASEGDHPEVVDLQATK